jgi:hypothetical protein
MSIFYEKRLKCGCVILASESLSENDCTILTNHCNKLFCNKCMNLTDEELDNRINKLQNDKENNKVCVNGKYVYKSNGWTRITPDNYYVNDEITKFLNGINE